MDLTSLFWETIKQAPILLLNSGFIYFLAVLILGVVLVNILKIIQYKNTGFSQIDMMKGWEFEKYLASLFKDLGYSARVVGSSRGDYGGDLLISKEGKKTLVQAKRWNSKVDQKAIREAYAAINVYGSDNAMVVTNNYFTNPAKYLAKKNNVILWDRTQLRKSIKQARKK